MIERDREDLVRPAGRRRSSLPAVAHRRHRKDNRLPQTKSVRLNDSARALRVFLVALRRFVVSHLAQPAVEQFERVEPKRVDLDRFSAARRHHPIAHLRVHPGELITFLALHEQTVLRIDVDIEFRSAQMMLDDVDQRRQQQSQA